LIKDCEIKDNFLQILINKRGYFKTKYPNTIQASPFRRKKIKPAILNFFIQFLLIPDLVFCVVSICQNIGE